MKISILSISYLLSIVCDEGERIMKKSKMEFSKKIYILNIILVIFVVISSLTLIALSGRLGLTDLSPLSVICTSGFGELAIHSGFYANKAKAENVIKISKQIGNIDNEKVELANQIMNGEFNSNM
nr:MAG TPA: hypothetical protein [Caudoviricetes sp.]